MGHPDSLSLLNLNPLQVGYAVRVTDESDGTVWYGTVGDQGATLMTRSDLLPAAPKEGSAHEK